MDYKKHVFGLVKELFIILGFVCVVSFPFILWLFVAYMCQILY